MHPATVMKDAEAAAQYVVSGRNFSMNFLLLCIQSSVCVLCVLAVKKLRIISFRNFDVADAKAWFPISFLLVTVIYSGSKSLVRSLASFSVGESQLTIHCSNS